MIRDLQLCTFCLGIWLLASAPQRESDTGFTLNASDTSTEVLKESAVWQSYPGTKDQLRTFFSFSFFFFFFSSQWKTRKKE